MTVRMQAADRRAQLLVVALDVFGAQGYHNTSMNAVAEAAGVTKPVLYQHFASKQELFLELLRDTAHQVAHVVTAEVVATGDQRGQVNAGMAAYFGYFAANPSAFTVLFGDGVRAVDQFAAERRQLEAHLATNLATLIHIEDIDDDTRMTWSYGLLGLAEGVLRNWFERDRPISQAAVVEMTAEFAWFGLRGSRH